VTITSIAPDRTTATIDHTIIVDIVGGVNVMPAIQRQWCFEAIDTCAFDWMRLAAAVGVNTHDSTLGQAGVTPANIRIVCEVVPKGSISRFDQGEYGYGVWGDPRLPENHVYIWDGLGANPPPFGGRMFFKETVIHALGDIATVALAPQKDPWKMAELGMAMGLGTVTTESFDTPNTPPDLLMPPDSRPKQTDLNNMKKPSINEAYNAWLGVGKHIKQLHRDDFFEPIPGFPDETDNFYYLYWGKTVGLDGVPGMYNPDNPEVVGGGGMFQETYITVDAPPWDEDPREFMAEAFKDIYAANGAYRFANRTKLKADYRVVDKHFSILLPLGGTGYTGAASDIGSALLGVNQDTGALTQNELSIRTGLPHSKITQHSSIQTRPWGMEDEPHVVGTTYEVSVQTTIEQQDERQTVTAHEGYKRGLTIALKIDEPHGGVSEEDWLAGVGLGIIGSQINMQILVNIATLPDHSPPNPLIRPGIDFGNTIDGVTEVSPFLAGVAVINRHAPNGSPATFPLNIHAEWHAHSRRGPGRLATGVVKVKGWDNGVMVPADRHMGRGVTAADQHEPAVLDSGGTGYAQPLTVNGI
jgi:hypothetical protein